MRTIPAQEIKRHGISYIDAILQKGPVHIVKNNQLRYVILTEDRYQTYCEMEEEAYLFRIQQSLQDLKAKKVSRGSAKKLIKELGLDK